MEEGLAVVKDLGAPDSWETADLEESMTSLLVSTSRTSTASFEFVVGVPPRESAPFSTPSSLSSPPPASSSPVVAAAISDRGGGGGVPEDATGQVDQFLREALEKPRERLSILRMEQDIERFIHDPTQQQLELQPLPTSYLRLAAHRIAQHYCLQSMAVPDNSSLDGSGSRIVLYKTSECRLPPIRLVDIPVNLPHEDTDNVVKVAIKQRPHKHSLSIISGSTLSSRTNHPKSVEERKEEYNRARARIFSSNNSSDSTEEKSDSELTLPDGFQRFPLVSTQSEEKSVVERPEVNVGQGLDGCSTGSSRSSQGRIEKEPVVNRYKASNRVAIFRDREVDRKDPDYDRSYERYTQRFDPGFGFNGGPYGIQPMYSRALNYSVEFPHLGSSHGPQIFTEHHPHPIPQHQRGPWGASSAPTALGYPPPEGMMAPFNPSHVGAHSASSIYLHSSHYVAPRQPGMAFVHSHEHAPPFAQVHQQQPEASLGLPRPR